MNGRGYIVLSLSRPAPANSSHAFREHPDLDSAATEARRLALANPGETFVVYRAVRQARTSDPVAIVDLVLDDDDSIPF